MSKEEKRRLYIIGAIVVAVVILLLLWGRKAVAGNTVINQAGDFSPSYGSTPIQLGDIPSLEFGAGKVNSRGCAVCYSGYGRIVAPSAPAPAPSPEIHYLLLAQGTNMQPAPPPPQPTRAVLSSSPVPSASAWWQGMAPGGRA